MVSPDFAGRGRQSAARVLSHFVHLDQIPDDLDLWLPHLVGALRGAGHLSPSPAAPVARGLFRQLATLQLEPPVIEAVDELAWVGPTPAFETWATRLGEPALWRRATALAPPRKADGAAGAKGRPHEELLRAVDDQGDSRDEAGLFELQRKSEACATSHAAPILLLSGT